MQNLKQCFEKGYNATLKGFRIGCGSYQRC